MTRGGALVAVAFVGTVLFSTCARAAAPNESDIEACTKEAAAATTPSTGSPSTDGTTTQELSARSSTEATVKSTTPDSAASAASRQAFAACLARHGYYKGYYRSGSRS